ncbi:MAG: TetR/AcrR family transcriptional regulator [Actinobacteria bacterium]|jgi:AcrR family transcriptional regulator|nr:TetR/AcrR family transcriptional regulator [Actinomycetota bacterium]
MSTTQAEVSNGKASTARRGPRRVRLDTAKIVAAGLEVAEESGSSVFSPKLLGDKLSVDPSAVYRHFQSKRHLMEALLDAVQLRTLEAVTAPKEAWRERVTQLAAATFSEYCRCPSIAAEAMTLTTHGPGEQGAVELLLDAFIVCGLPEDEAVRYYALVSAYILSVASGIARSRADGGEPMVTGPEDDTSWLDGPILVDPKNYPRTAMLTVQLSELRDREIYMQGVTALLDAAERAARS